MFGKPFHRMPDSAWMIPGGNREMKNSLIKAQRYPMKSVIQKNLGGPLSDVFFSCLTPAQKDLTGCTPSLKGPGRNLWVSPSDMLIGKCKLTPPFTIRAQQALTHQAILEYGAEIEARFHKKHELHLQETLEKKELEMKQHLETMINKALEKDREEQYEKYRKIAEQSATDTAKSYQRIFDETLAQLNEEHRKKIEEAVEKTEREMEHELSRAILGRSDHLTQQYEFQLACKESCLVEKYENIIKKIRQECATSMDKLQKQHIIDLKKVEVQLEAKHVTDLVMQALQMGKEHDKEMKDLEITLKTCFFNLIGDENAKRDFVIVELENEIRELKKKCENNDIRFEEVFRHFQKFINCVLGEKPGQADYLLCLEGLKEGTKKEKAETDVNLMARMIRWSTFNIFKQIDKWAIENNTVRLVRE